MLYNVSKNVNLTGCTCPNRRFYNSTDETEPKNASLDEKLERGKKNSEEVQILQMWTVEEKSVRKNRCNRAHLKTVFS